MNAGDARDIDADDAEVFHLLGREARPDQVYTAAEPAVLRAPLFKANVSSSFKLSHQPVDILFRNLVDFTLESLIDLLKVLQVFMLVVHAPLEKRSLTLNLTDQLVVVD